MARSRYRQTTNERNFEMKTKLLSKVQGIEIHELWWELKPGKVLK